MRIQIAFVLVLVSAFASVALVACKKEPSPPGCGDRAKSYDEALAAPGAGKCSTRSDCVCFRGGVSEKHECGGVTDTTTNEKLETIAAAYVGAKCNSGIDCAARMCLPACENGKCVEATPAAATPPVDAAISPSTSASASFGATDAGALDCNARIVEMDRVIASATRKCKTDRDCACFRGGVSKKDPCGGITDAKTNERFESLSKQWAAAGCKNEGVACPAMLCQTTCNAGTCGPPEPGKIIQ